MVVVEVDTALGTVKPLSFVAAHDVGQAINPLLVEGQVQGGIAQGLGMALMEEYIPGRTENLHDYLIPTIGDIPPIETIIIDLQDWAPTVSWICWTINYQSPISKVLTCNNSLPYEWLGIV